MKPNTNMGLRPRLSAKPAPIGMQNKLIMVSVMDLP
eukprot:COSAG03_NODE_4650_length_1479_cov_1.502899_1_plen_35_part_10